MKPILLACVSLLGITLTGCGGAPATKTSTIIPTEKPAAAQVTQTAQAAAVQTIDAALAAEETSAPAAAMAGRPTQQTTSTAESTWTLQPTYTPRPTYTPLPTATRTLRPTYTPLPTDTPYPTPVLPFEVAIKRLEDRFGMAFVHVPAGEFTMGSPSGEGGEDEHPQHTVYVDEFWIGKTEVTNAQYRPFVEAGGYQQRDLWTKLGWNWREGNDVTQPGYWDNEQWNQPDYPVVCVSWYEAVAYTHWLAQETGLEVRLPTEAEWEKAARGTDGRTWPWGEKPPDGKRMNYCDRNCETDSKDEAVDDGYQYTAPVGSYPDGASPYGALDMAGNVWEWTSSLYESYPYRAGDEQQELETSECCRVGRGGASDTPPVNARTAERNWDDPDFRTTTLGLRVAIARR